MEEDQEGGLREYEHREFSIKNLKHDLRRKREGKQNMKE